MASSWKDIGLYLPRVGPFAGMSRRAVYGLSDHVVPSACAPFEQWYRETSSEPAPFTAQRFWIQGQAGIQAAQTTTGGGATATGAVFVNCHEFRLSKDGVCGDGGKIIVDGNPGNAGVASAGGCCCVATANGGGGGNGASGGGGGGAFSASCFSQAEGGAGGSGGDGSNGHAEGPESIAGPGGLGTKDQGCGVYSYFYGAGGNGDDTNYNCGIIIPGGTAANGYGGGGAGGTALNSCGSPNAAGGGGGGAGGLIVVAANMFTSDNIGACILSAIGGAGGGADGPAIAGGKGGDGVIWMAFRQKLIGSPTIGASTANLYEIRQDGSLIQRNWVDTWNNL